MGQDMKVNGEKINYTIKFIIKNSIVLFVLYFRESIAGQMEEDMKADGKIVICTVKENIHGKMADSMKEIISMIKKLIIFKLLIK